MKESQIKEFLNQISSAIEMLQISVEGLYAQLEQASEPKVKKPKRAKGPILEFQDEQLNGFLSTVSHEIQKDWIVLYRNIPWIKEEMKKANIWLKAKGGRKRNTSLFISNWLSKAEAPKQTNRVVPDVSFYEPKY